MSVSISLYGIFLDGDVPRRPGNAAVGTADAAVPHLVGRGLPHGTTAQPTGRCRPAEPVRHSVPAAMLVPKAATAGGETEDRGARGRGADESPSARHPRRPPVTDARGRTAGHGGAAVAISHLRGLGRVSGGRGAPGRAAIPPGLGGDLSPHPGRGCCTPAAGPAAAAAAATAAAATPATSRARGGGGGLTAPPQPAPSAAWLRLTPFPAAGPSPPHTRGRRRRRRQLQRQICTQPRRDSRQRPRRPRREARGQKAPPAAKQPDPLPRPRPAPQPWSMPAAAAADGAAVVAEQRAAAAAATTAEGGHRPAAKWEPTGERPTMGGAAAGGHRTAAVCHPCLHGQG